MANYMISVPLRGLLFLMLIILQILKEVVDVSVPLRGLLFLIRIMANHMSEVAEFPSPYGDCDS